METDLLEKLKLRVEISATGCWEWQGAIGSTGYGNTYWRGKYINTHKAMWVALHGAPLPGQFVLHRCDNKRCINPSHLFLGTQGDNMKDKADKGRATPGPCSKPAWWTPERRAKKAEQMRIAMRDRHEEAAAKAGAPIEWKYCPSCFTWFPKENFYKNAARYDGLKPHCKRCAKKKDSARKAA